MGRVPTRSVGTRGDVAKISGIRVTAGGLPLVRTEDRPAGVVDANDVLLARGELADVVRSGTLGPKGIAPRSRANALQSGDGTSARRQGCLSRSGFSLTRFVCDIHSAVRLKPDLRDALASVGA
jgi:hypothetical protein